MVIMTDRPDMTIAVYRGRKATKQQQQLTNINSLLLHGRKLIFRALSLNIMC